MQRVYWLRVFSLQRFNAVTCAWHLDHTRSFSPMHSSNAKYSCKVTIVQPYSRKLAYKAPSHPVWHPPSAVLEGIQTYLDTRILFNNCTQVHSGVRALGNGSVACRWRKEWSGFRWRLSTRGRRRCGHNDSTAWSVWGPKIVATFSHVYIIDSSQCSVE
jgi:hypothetical protein